MNQLPSPESGANTTQQDAHVLPRPRGRESGAETAPLQTTTGTEADCAVDPGALERDVDQERVRLEARTVETFRTMRTKLGEFLED